MRNAILLNNLNEVLIENTRQAQYSCVTGKYAMNVVLSGQSDYIIGSRALKLTSGNFLFTNSDTNYSFNIDSLEPVKMLILLFDEDFVLDFHHTLKNNHSRLLDQHADDAKVSKPGFLETIHLMQGGLAQSTARLNALVETSLRDNHALEEHVYDCLQAYYELYEREIVQRAFRLEIQSRSTRNEILRRLMIAKDYILSNYNQQITLKDIAFAACLSVNHLLRTFKQAFKVSPYQFLTQARLQQASYLLENTDYPIKEIVNIVGFDCPSSFIRLFKGFFKYTPGKYKQQCHNVLRMETFAYS